jgi:hypothetical protein
MQRMAVIAVLTILLAGSGMAQGGRGRGPQGPPDIAGTWTGTSSAYNPARAETPPKEQCAKLSATADGQKLEVSCTAMRRGGPAKSTPPLPEVT